MKKIAKVLSLAISSVAIFFASCANSIDGSLQNAYMNGVLLNSSQNSGETKTLNVYAVSEDGLVDFSDSTESRTFMPDAIKHSELSFYLWGKEVSEQEPLYGENGKLVQFKAAGSTIVDSFDNTAATANVGTVPVNLKTANYNLCLAAVPKSALSSDEDSITNIMAKAVLYANAVADLRYNESVKFYLSTANLNGKGKVTLNLRTYETDESGNGAYWSDERYYAQISVQQLNDGKVLSSGTTASSGTQTQDMTVTANGSNVTGSGIYSTPSSKTDSTYNWNAQGNLAYSNTGNEYGVKYVMTGVPSGTYNFVVDFTNESGRHFYYSERIIVLANQETKANIDIPNVIEKAPKAPSNLKVGYVAPTDTITDNYLCTFEWKDNANNEESFVLQLMDLTDLVKTAADNSGTSFNLNEKAVAALTYAAQADDAAVSGVPNEWVTAAADSSTVYYSLDKTCYQQTDSIYAGGSLDKNSNSVSVWLPLGHVFAARICAYNSASNAIVASRPWNTDAEWVYANTKALTGGNNNEESLTSVSLGWTTENKDSTPVTPKHWKGSATDNAKAFESSVTDVPLAINLYKITYNLFGGSFWAVNENASLITTGNDEAFGNPTDNKTASIPGIVKSETTATSANYDCILEFHTVTGAGTPVLSPIGYKYNETSYATLFKGDYVWTSWKLNSTSGDEVKVGAQALYTNCPKYFRHIEWAKVTSAGSDVTLNATKAGSVYEIAKSNFVATYVDGTTASDESGKAYYINSTHGFVSAKSLNKNASDIDELSKLQALSSDSVAYIRATPAPYKDSRNISLFAAYNATSASVNIYNPEDYALETANIRVYKQHAAESEELANYYGDAEGTYKDGEINGNVFKMSTFYDKIIVKVIETEVSDKQTPGAKPDKYRNAEIIVRKTTGETNTRYVGTKTQETPTGNVVGSGSGSSEPLAIAAHNAYKFVIPTTGWTPGKYQITINAFSDIQPKPFTYVLTVSVTDQMMWALPLTSATSFYKMTEAEIEKATSVGEYYSESSGSYAKLTTAPSKQSKTDGSYPATYRRKEIPFNNTSAPYNDVTKPNY